MLTTEALAYSGETTAPQNKLFLVLDWSRESAVLLKNVIEARKRLLMEYMYDVEVDHVVQWGEKELGDRMDYPLLYYNGELVSQGEALNPEDIVNIVLDYDVKGNKKIEKPNIYGSRKKPFFNAIAMV
jgi:hypothetical protein